jgi:hypothetical protein
MVSFFVLSVQGRGTYTTTSHFDSSRKHLHCEQITCLHARFFIIHYYTHIHHFHYFPPSNDTVTGLFKYRCGLWISCRERATQERITAGCCHQYFTVGTTYYIPDVRGYRYLVSQHTDSIISIFSNLRVIGFMHRTTELIYGFI